MAKAPRKRNSTKSGWNPVAIISAVTDSVERLGADNAFCATIIALGFTAYALGANAVETLLLAGGLILVVLGFRWGSLKIEERRARGQLEILRETRGLELLKLAGERSNQLSFLDDED